MKPEDITLDWLHARVVERDGCLIWIKHIGSGGVSPQARIGDRVIAVRKTLWELVHECGVPKNRQIGTICKDPACVHPDHLVSRAPGAVLRGKPIPLTQKIKIALAQRAKSGISDEDVSDIRSSSLTPAELSKKHGVDISYIGHIRRNEARIDYSNPFSGLAR